MGVARTEIIGVLASLGVADELAGGPLTTEELAARLGVDADALHRVMRVAAADGLFKPDRRGRFRLTRPGRTLGGGSPATPRPRGRHKALASTRRGGGGPAERGRTGRPPLERGNGP